MINDLKTLCEWKIQLKIAINYFSSKDSKETRTMDKKEIWKWKYGNHDRK